jgi:hypothetical protein
MIRIQYALLVIKAILRIGSISINRIHIKNIKKIVKNKILVSTNIMGCISSAPADSAPETNSIVPGQNPSLAPSGIVRQVTITLTSDDKDDIFIVKSGDHYLIQGSKAVVDIETCKIIGHLDENNVVRKEMNEHIKVICEKHDMEFSA